MMRKYRILSAVVALLLAAVACSLPAEETPPPNSLDALNTIVAETVIADLTQKAQIIFTSTEPVTFTPAFTATLTETPTPLFTATPTVPLISVSVDTNCRIGPGKVYDRIDALLVGETAEVFGRDPTGGYWYIRSPRSTNRFCWVWGEYAALSGPVQVLPVFTPPPTPTATATPTPTATPTASPDFKAKYAGLDSCGGNWWVEVDLKNTGSVTFRSMEIRVVDTVTKVNLTSLVNDFTDLDGCLKTTKKDVLEPGSAFTISAPEFDYDPSGNKLRVTITLCSKTGQKGRCESKRIVFMP